MWVLGFQQQGGIHVCSGSALSLSVGCSPWWVGDNEGLETFYVVLSEEHLCSIARACMNPALASVSCCSSWVSRLGCVAPDWALALLCCRVSGG